ncbi:MAG: hypothetical protein ABSB15_11930 [Bryobacteraceae bacterium]|jgi:hypothetical protein
MINWLAVAAVVWLFLVAGVVFFAVCRISAAMQDGRLNVNDPLHVRLQHLIEFSDRIGISLTIGAFICSAVLASMLVQILFRQ